MPLDEVSRRSVFLHQHDMRRLVEEDRARTTRREEVHYDAGTRMATWETNRGEVVGRWYGEVLASYVVFDHILRWAWAGRSSVETPTHVEIIPREASARSIPQLGMSVVGDLDEEEATMLVRLGALVAGAVGVHVLRSDEGVSFIGLFDSPRPRDGEPDPSRYSIPPPQVARTSVRPMSTPPAPSVSAPPSGPRRSSAPPPRSLGSIREVYGPRSVRGPRDSSPERSVREPTRSIFLPVATALLAALARSAAGFREAVFVLHVDGEPSELRTPIVVLVATDAKGQLVVVESGDALVQAAARLIEADRNDGNGPWRKLTARVTPKPDGGATLHVDVL
jgi:hypothetical protein